MNQTKDHYKTLGVTPAAGMPEIKKAYRSLAIIYHPDKNDGDALSEARIKDINEAYSILSDPGKRAAYDDERWLSGMGGRTSYAQGITPAWLQTVCVELNSSLATMDTHRLSQNALQAYINLILSDAHLSVLQHEASDEQRARIISEILQAAQLLQAPYLAAILPPLYTLAGKGTQVHTDISDYYKQRLRTYNRERMYPYIVLAVTLALCLFMYLYSNF